MAINKTMTTEHHNVSHTCGEMYRTLVLSIKLHVNRSNLLHILSHIIIVSLTIILKNFYNQ